MILVAYRHGLRPPSWRTCGGIRWTSGRPTCTSAGSSRAPRAPIRSSGTNCGRCGGFSASRSQSHPSCSRRSAGRRSARPGSPAWSSGQGSRQSLPSRRTRTCCGMPAVMRWRTRATTPGHSRPTSATATFSTRCATLSCHRRGSRIFGARSLANATIEHHALPVCCSNHGPCSRTSIPVL